MTKEQEEAIKLAENFTKMDFSNPIGWTGYYDTELKELSEAIETVLSMLKENSAEIQQKNTELAEKNAEIEKKDKIIDLMARAIDNYDSQLVINTFKDKEHVKQYFERKCEE